MPLLPNEKKAKKVAPPKQKQKNNKTIAVHYPVIARTYTATIGKRAKLARLVYINLLSANHTKHTEESHPAPAPLREATAHHISARHKIFVARVCTTTMLPPKRSATTFVLVLEEVRRVSDAQLLAHKAQNRSGTFAAGGNLSPQLILLGRVGYKKMPPGGGGGGGVAPSRTS